MKKIIFRADDLGYSEAVNYGILKSINDGLIRNAGLMVNMDTAKHGVELIKDANICLGIHTNISSGKPILDPKLIPSLVNEKGKFKSSNEYKKSESDIVFEEAINEVEAQYHRFVELVGKKPDYFDAHAVNSENFEKAVESIARKYSIKYSPFPKGKTNCVKIGSTEVRMHGGSSFEKSSDECLKDIIDNIKENEFHMIVYHPGYLDAYILENSTLTINRPFETATLCSKESRLYLDINNIICATYEEL